MEFMFGFISHPNCSPEIHMVICILKVFPPRSKKVRVRRDKQSVKPCRQKDCKSQAYIASEHCMSVVEGGGVEN